MRRIVTLLIAHSPLQSYHSGRRSSRNGRCLRAGCGLCEIDVGDNQLFLVVGLADDRCPYGSTTTDWPANVTSPSLPTRLHMTMATWFCMAWTRIFHRNGFDGSASVFGTDARRRHDDQAAPRNAHVRMPSRGSLK